MQAPLPRTDVDVDRSEDDGHMTDVHRCERSRDFAANSQRTATKRSYHGTCLASVFVNEHETFCDNNRSFLWQSTGG